MLTSKTAQVFLHDGLIHSSTATDTLSVVVGNPTRELGKHEVRMCKPVTYEHHQSALLLIYLKMMFSMAVGIPGTFQGTAQIVSKCASKE